MSRQIILASQSPRRRELLQRIGLIFDTIAPDVNEHCAGSAKERVMQLSLRKARAVFQAHTQAMVIGADTLVELPGCILEKPKDREDAFHMLRSLSGRWHDVYSGVTLLGPAYEETIAEHSRVHFTDLSDSLIDWYIDTGEPMDKAGAYGIQGAACRFIDRIEGCFFNIMGLPVARLSAMLCAAGVK